MPRVRLGFPVEDARQRVPTVEFFHSSRGSAVGAEGCLAGTEGQGKILLPYELRCAEAKLS